jgi:hypothetical protein
MKRKSLSFSDLWTFLECPKMYLARQQRKTQKRNKEMLVGDVAHAVAEHHGEQTEEIRTFIAKELALLPEEERAQTISRIEQVTANAQEMAELDDDDDNETDREKVYRWFFEEFGWTICAKPDKLDYSDDGRRKIMEITDYKSGCAYESTNPANGQRSFKPKSKHKEQIYFFALVISLAENWTGPIKLNLRYWGNKADCPPMWYSHNHTWNSLDRLGKQIKRIEECTETQNFPATPRHHCKGCPLLASCAEGQKWMEENNRTQLRVIEALPEPAIA